MSVTLPGVRLKKLRQTYARVWAAGWVVRASLLFNLSYFVMVIVWMLNDFSTQSWVGLNVAYISGNLAFWWFAHLRYKQAKVDLVRVEQQIAEAEALWDLPVAQWPPHQQEELKITMAQRILNRQDPS